MRYPGYILKRKAEDLFIFPFVLAGRLLAILVPLKRRYRSFFFFPFYHTGGAEQVHAQIAKAAGGEDCIVFFTRKSKDTRFLELFKNSGCTIADISRYTDNRWLYFLNLIWRGRISHYINKQEIPTVVLNGQCNFGYKISPWLRRGIRQVELIHSFNTFSWIRIPFLPFITATVMISRVRIEQHLEQYRRLGIPKSFDARISYIPNAIELPGRSCQKQFEQKPRVLFVGRGTKEKRPEIFIEMARQNPGLDFTAAGAIPGHLLSAKPSNLECLGNIDNPDELHEIYCAHHILVIPSSTEGFPMVLMEAMARGCAVMATPVGDIPYHIQPSTGWLFSSTDALVLLAEAKQWFSGLSPARLSAMSASAVDYANENFGIDRFNRQYRAILQP
ncbi:MAG TPA: glycosyltransferase family 4 protein [Chitinophagaceae bacterium]